MKHFIHSSFPKKYLVGFLMLLFYFFVGNISVFAQMNITSVSPSQNELNIPTNSNITISYDTSIDNNSLLFNSITVYGNQTGFYTGTWSGGNSATTTFDSDTDFKAGEKITVNFNTATKGTGGELFTSAWQYQFDVEANGTTSSFLTVFTTINTNAPYRIVEGDFNNDGLIDLAGTTQGTDEVIIHTNQGDFKFTQTDNIGIGTNPQGLTVGDINNDNNLDIVACNTAGNTISILFGNGDGTFQTPVNTSVVASPEEVEIGDIDGDGFQDIMVVGSAGISLFINNGDGTFPVTPISHHSTEAMTAVTLGDLDNDGDLDIGVYGNNQVRTYLNQGANSFITSSSTTIGANFTDMINADFDNDGSAEIIIVNQGSNGIKMFENDNSGVFSHAGDAFSSHPLYTVDYGDIDGDGDLDVVVNGSTDKISIFRNDGVGNLTFTIETPITIKDGLTSNVLADFDDDGDLDIAVAGFTSNNITLLENINPFNVTSVIPTQNAIDIPINSDITINFDADIDASSLVFNTATVYGNQTGFITGVWTNSGTTTAIFNPDNDFKPTETISINFSTAIRGTGGEEFTSAWQYQFKVEAEGAGFFYDFGYVMPDSEASTAAEIGDFDNDGDLDIVVANGTGASSRAQIWLNDGAGNFVTVSHTFIKSTRLEVVVGDVNSDGNLDLIFTNYGGGTNQLWHGNGDGTFAAGPNVGSNTSHSAILADIDGDGDLDYFDLKKNGVSQLVLNDGTGIFSAGQLFTSATPANNKHYGAVGDIDNDGDLDFYLAASLSSDEIWKNDGVGNFTTITQLINDGALTGNKPTFGDLDGDGDLDIVLCYGGDPDEIWINDGSGNFTFSSNLDRGANSSKEIGLGDFDGDGDLDAFIAKTTEANEVWTNNGSGTFIFSHEAGNGGNGAHAEFGDLDGDGTMDVFIAYHTQANETFFNKVPINVVSVNPTQNAINIPTNSNIVVDFTSAIDNNSLVFNSITVTGNRSGQVAGFWSGGGTTQATFSPASGFLPGEFITINFTTATGGVGGEQFVSAYESVFTVQFLTGIVYVNRDATAGNNDGSDWANAFLSVGDALAYSTSGAEIWVADGTYYPNYDVTGNPNPVSSADKTFVMKEGVEIYGGFNGTETLRNQRDYKTNITILSGDLDNDDGAVTGNGATLTFSQNGINSLHVITNENNGLTNAAILDGFTITKGYSTGGTDRGAGMYNWNNAHPLVQNCIFTENRAGNLGGAVTCAFGASAKFVNCAFTKNYAVFAGAGVGTRQNSSTVSIYNCLFDGNYAGNKGGAVHSQQATSAFLYNCTFVDNYAVSLGGAINTSTSNVTVANNIFFGNLTAGTGNSIHVESGSSISSYSLYDDTNATNAGITSDGGNNIFGSNPLLSITNGLSPNSPAIDTGNDAVNPELYDLMGNDRKLGTIDMGAYEFQQINVTSVIPTQNAINISVDAFITIDFTSAISNNSLNFNSITVIGSRSGSISGVWTGGGTTQARFTPASDFKAGEFITIDFSTTTEAIGGEKFMSAYESVFTVQFLTGFVYVDRDATAGNNDGSDWDNAFLSVNDALDFSTSGAEIWVANGTYKPTGVAGDRTKSFDLKHGVSLFGGFEGLGGAEETARNQRDANTNETILSGDIDGIPDNVTGTFPSLVYNNYNNNSYHILFAKAGVSDVVIDGFTIQGGHVDGSAFISSGAGLYAEDAFLTIQDCIFQENKSNQHGGAVKVINTEISFSSVQFLRNYVDKNGALNVSNSDTYLKNVLFENNYAGKYGAGIYISGGGGLTRVFNSSFNENSAYDNGGAVIVENAGNVIFANTIFDNNEAEGVGEGKGGAIDLYYGDADIINCTFVNNHVSGQGFGGGISVRNTSNLLLRNSIFYKNTADVEGNSLYWDNDGGATCDVDYSLVQDASASISLTGMNNIIGKDPLFKDLNTDYQLLKCSPARNAGYEFDLPADELDLDDDGDISEFISVDFNGDIRVFDGTLDMGAIEFQTVPESKIVYVKANVGGGNYDGTSWTNAYSEFGDALKYSCSGDKIWVAKGTYFPDNSDQIISFELKDNVKIYGGFPDTGNPTMTDRDYMNNPTVLSGDIDGDGALTGNSYHVIFATGTTQNTLLDGFTITGGNANGGGNDDNGAGVYLDNAGLTIQNCFITGNHATETGGSVNINGSGEQITFINTVFDGNTAFSGFGSGSGGALYNDGTSITIINSVFSSNTSATGGGAIHNNGSSTSSFITIINSTFYDNNCLESASAGGAITNDFAGAELRIYNSIFDNNSANGDNHIASTGTVSTATFSAFDEALPSTTSDAGFTMLFANPQFTDATNGDFSLLNTSPVIDAGNNDFITLSTDISGANRIIGGTVDMGAYEASGSEIDLLQTTFITSGETYDFGTTSLNTSMTQTFTIQNNGSADLTFATSSAMSISGYSDFTFNTVSFITGNLISPSQEVKFEVTFNPTTTGQKEAFISILSDDGDEPTYILRLLGETPFSGNYLGFDGDDDEILTLTTVGFSGNQPRTLETWIKFDKVIDEQMNIATWGDAPSSAKFGLQLKNKTLHFNHGGTLSDANFQPEPKRWYHLAINFDGASIIKILVNGQIIHTENTTAFINDTQLEIGGAFSGNLDELRIWNRALTQDEIQANMYQRLANDEPNLVAYYTFDNGIPNGDNTGRDKLFDQTANANHGTLQTFDLSGKFSNWLGHATIEVKNSTGTQLANNQIIDLGTIIGGTTVNYPIKIYNTGHGDLDVIPFMTASSAFVPSLASFASPVIPNANTTINLAFSTIENGEFFATVQLTNSDLFEPVYFLTITGKVNANPEIAVFKNTTTSVSQYDKFSFGQTQFWNVIESELIIENQGFETLVLANPNGVNFEALEIFGSHPDDFSIIEYPDNEITNQSTFKIRFRPRQSGTRKATLWIYSNDADENPFVINLEGVGICPTITDIITIAPTQCNTPEGQLIIQLTDFVTSMSYNIDLNNDGEIEAENAQMSETGQFIIENLALDSEINSIKITPYIGECVMFKEDLNLFMTSSNLPRTDITLSADITEISPNYPVTFTFENAETGIAYGLFDKQTNLQIGDFVFAENPDAPVTLTTDFLTADFTYYIIAKNEGTGCQVRIENTQDNQVPIVRVYSSLRDEEVQILRQLYNSTGGKDNWVFKWDFTGVVSELQGVEIFAGKVIKIDLKDNGLIDKLPTSILLLPKLELLDVSGNNLSFASLEGIGSPEFEFIYENQASLETADEIEITEGEMLFMTVSTPGENNFYQWYKDGELIQGATASFYRVAVSGLSDAGVYYAEVRNTLASDEVMERREVTVTVFPKQTEIDISPLQVFFETLGGDFWGIPWDLEDVSLYEQYGLKITAEDDQIYVISIDLPKNNLVGEIPNIFDDEMFSRLQFVNLSGNSLTGEMPLTLTQLETIVYLDLSDNLYSGSIPSIITNMTGLQSLSLSHNNFSQIPSGIFDNLENLETLYLNNNRFKDLPADIGTLTNLLNLNLSQNLLSDLPDEFQNLTKLRQLWLSNNRLVTLPDYITNFADLWGLYLVNNFLTSLPENFTDLNLTYLTLFNNSLDHADLEPIISRFIGGHTEREVTILYAPQAKISEPKDLFLESNALFSLSITTPGEANTYQWYKNGEPIDTPAGRQKTLDFGRITIEEAGVYNVEVSNLINKDLTLRSYNYIVSVGCGNKVEASVLVDENAPLEFCKGDDIRVLLRSEKTDGYNIHWLRDGIKIANATTLNFNATLAGTYAYILVDAIGCSSKSVNDIIISEKSLPTASLVNQGDTITVESQDTIIAYRWHLNSEPIEGANTSTFIARKEGIYQVELMSSTGCRAFSEPLYIRVNSIEETQPLSTELEVYPNPATDILWAKIPSKFQHQTASIEIWDIHGKLIASKTEILQARVRVDLAKLPYGYYLLKIDTDNELLLKNFIKENR